MVPVADENEHEQKDGDHDQPGSLGRVDRMPMVFLGSAVLGVRRGHGDIVVGNSVWVLGVRFGP